MSDAMKGYVRLALAGLVLLAVLIALLFGAMVANKHYKVWAKGQDGKAILREAESSRLVQIEEAKANLESERLNAQAEVVRAKGAAESMEIEGGKLTEQYIQYLWVRNLKGAGEIIYIPTEAGLPMLEAGKRP